MVAKNFIAQIFVIILARGWFGSYDQ